MSPLKSIKDTLEAVGTSVVMSSPWQPVALAILRRQVYGVSAGVLCLRAFLHLLKSLEFLITDYCTKAL